MIKCINCQYLVENNNEDFCSYYCQYITEIYKLQICPWIEKDDNCKNRNDGNSEKLLGV